VLAPDVKPEVRNMATSKEVRKFANGEVELVSIAGGTVGRFVLRKGWKWSNDVKPIVKTEWCEAPHLQYVISGKYRIKMKDGTEFDIGKGDVASVPPGHDAWVVGDESIVGVEFIGARVATTRGTETAKGKKRPK
jgi:mannose-6-phosphate isomerase-like protein (cupin superfamily)